MQRFRCTKFFLTFPLWEIWINSWILQDKYKRSLADGENMRRRLSKQIDDAKLFGIQGFCKDLLSVSDILQKATECVPADEINSNTHLKNLYQGLTMTEAELQKVWLLLIFFLCLILNFKLLFRCLNVTDSPKLIQWAKNSILIIMKLYLNK